jgi:ABC-type multidrug transport system ATPase subunit
MLMYTAELKRPISQSHAEKKSAVEELIDVLALEGCRNVLIGNSMTKGISGGQVRLGVGLGSGPGQGHCEQALGPTNP